MKEKLGKILFWSACVLIMSCSDTPPAEVQVEVQGEVSANDALLDSMANLLEHKKEIVLEANDCILTCFADSSLRNYGHKPGGYNYKSTRIFIENTKTGLIQLLKCEIQWDDFYNPFEESLILRDINNDGNEDLFLQQYYAGRYNYYLFDPLSGTFKKETRGPEGFRELVYTGRVGENVVECSDYNNQTTCGGAQRQYQYVKDKLLIQREWKSVLVDPELYKWKYTIKTYQNGQLINTEEGIEECYPKP